MLKLKSFLARFFAVFAVFFTCMATTFSQSAAMSIEFNCGSDKKFSFQISAKGEYEVWCDGSARDVVSFTSGGSSTITDINSSGYKYKITKTNVGLETFTCNYSSYCSDGQNGINVLHKTITFKKSGGGTTCYAGNDNNDDPIPAIKFLEPGKLRTISGYTTGSFGTIFPTVNTSGCSNRQPNFSGLFKNATKLNVGQFEYFCKGSGGYESSGAIYGAPVKNMFKEAFYNAGSEASDGILLTTLDMPAPASSFSVYSENMFRCLTGVTGDTIAPESVFESTFEGAKISGTLSDDGNSSNGTEYSDAAIGSNFFGTINKPGNYMFKNTFKDVKGNLFFVDAVRTTSSPLYVTSTTPSDVFGSLSGVDDGTGPESVFEGTFHNANVSGTLGNGFFGTINKPGNSMFLGTFSGVTGNITLPTSLFSSLTGVDVSQTAASKVFEGTFSGANVSGTLGNDFFGNIKKPGDSMFLGTFSGVTGNITLPTSLFSSLTGVDVSQTAASKVFAETFAGANVSGTLGNDFFGDINKPGDSMFMKTFYQINGSIALPTSLFSSLTGVESGEDAASNVFEMTFFGANVSGTLGNDFFGNIKQPGGSMFVQTFGYTTGSLTIGTSSSRSSLFGTLEGNAARKMFYNTFVGYRAGNIYMNSDFFGRPTTPAESMFELTFADALVNVYLPTSGDLFGTLNGAAAPNMFFQTFSKLNGLYGPISERFFGRITAPAENMFDTTFGYAPNVGSGQCISPHLFEGLSGYVANGGTLSDVTGNMKKMFDGTGLLNVTDFNNGQYTSNGVVYSLYPSTQSTDLLYWDAQMSSLPVWDGKASCTSDVTITLSKNYGQGTIKNNVGTSATETNSGSMTCTAGTSGVELPTWSSAASSNNTTNITKGTGTESKVFLGWSTDENCTTSSCAVSSITCPAGGATYYAVWGTPNCSVTNGSATIATTVANKPTCTMTCDNGYKTSGTYSGTANQLDESYTCTAKCNEITLDKNGGTGGTNYLYKKTGDTGWYSDSTCTTSVSTLPSAPSRTGYTYNGYYNSTTGSTNYITSSGTLNSWGGVTQDTTIYAQWTPNIVASAQDVSLTYNGTEQSCVVDNNGNITVTVPSSGYTITYSSTQNGTYSANGAPTLTNAGDSATVWYKVTASGYIDYIGSYTCSMNKANGTPVIKVGNTDVTGSMVDVTYPVATQQYTVVCPESGTLNSAASGTTSVATVTKSGNNVTATVVSAGTTVITVNCPATANYLASSATTTLRANSKTITLNKNGGDGLCGGVAGSDAGTLTCSYGGASCVAPSWGSGTCAIEKNLKVFTGWNGNDSGTGDDYTSNNLASTNVEVVYAKWDDIQCTASPTSVGHNSATASGVTGNTPSCTVVCNDGYTGASPQFGTAGNPVVTYACTIANCDETLRVQMPGAGGALYQYLMNPRTDSTPNTNKTLNVKFTKNGAEKVCYMTLSPRSDNQQPIAGSLNIVIGDQTYYATPTSITQN